MSDQTKEETAQREELGRRLSTETPNGAKGSASIAHHYDTVDANGTGEPAAAYQTDLDGALESTAPPAGKHTSADEPAQDAPTVKIEVSTSPA